LCNCYKPLCRHPPLSAHLGRSGGCQLNRGFTVFIDFIEVTCSSCKVLSLHSALLKCPYDQILKLLFFIFVHNRSFLDILPSFGLLWILDLVFFWTFISENLRLPLISWFQVVVENLRKWCNFHKNTVQIEIIITTSVENCTNIRAKVFVILYASCCTVIVLSTDVVFFSKWCNILQFSTKMEPGKLMAALL